MNSQALKYEADEVAECLNLGRYYYEKFYKCFHICTISKSFSINYVFLCFSFKFSGVKESPVVSHNLTLKLAKIIEQIRGQAGVKLP